MRSASLIEPDIESEAPAPMAVEKKRVLRIVVPLVVAALGVLVVVAGYRNSAGQPGARPPASAPSAPGVPAVAEAQEGADPPEAGGGGSIPGAGALPGGALREVLATEGESLERAGGEARQEEGAGEAAPAVAAAVEGAPSMGEGPPGLRARVQPLPDGPPASIGGLTPGGDYRSMVTFTLFGAGVESITMADYFETTARSAHYEVQRRVLVPGGDGRMEALASLAARAILVNGQLVDLHSRGDAPVWRETGPGSFEALIEDEGGAAVLRLERRFLLSPGSFVIEVDQRVENLSGRDLRVELVQYGPVELHEDIGGYGLDMRRVRIGHLLEPRRDPSRQFVEPDSLLMSRTTVIDRVLSAKRDGLVWPRPADFKGATEAVWLAQTSRYFAFAVMPRVDRAAAAANMSDPVLHPLDKRFRLADEVYAVVRGQGDARTLRLLLQLTSAPMDVGAGGSADLSFSAYAGPLGRRHLSPGADPVFGALALDGLVIYNIGGMCAWCTFQWLARLLVVFLTLLHDYVVFDWSVAIMILVVCVRGMLHPLTRRSQISMARFGRKMQALAPKQQKLREKYKDDPKRMQEEMVRLMKEEKVNYTGALGCLPLFLQSPIWFALYAMLYFSFDLRHAPAFYGVFQSATGGRWSFMADLSVSDHFIDFGGVLFSLPLFGPVTGVNILPLVLGVVFYVQQKYLTPPTTTPLTPEQQAQQKMIKIMMVVMFPLLMYNAPSGLAIYFITNSVLGILESRWIRAHISELDKQDEAGRGGAPGVKRIESTAKKRGG